MKIGKTSALVGITVILGLLLSTGCSLPFTTGGAASPEPSAATPIFVTPTSAVTGPTVIVITAAPHEAQTETPEPTSTSAVTSTPITTSTPTATLSPYLGSHTVQSGESLYSIGRAYGVDPAAIASENGVKPPYTIYRGQVLRIPPVKWSSIPAGPTAAQQFTPDWDAVGEYNYVIPTVVVRTYVPSDH